jgi:hypothetical protein
MLVVMLLTVLEILIESGTFYRHINDLGVVGRIDIDSYQTKEACLQPCQSDSSRIGIDLYPG